MPNSIIIKFLILNVLILGLVHAGCRQLDSREIPEEVRHIENLTYYPSDEEPLYNIELIRENAFGDTDNLFFSNMSSVVADDQDRVYISDFQENRVVVFQSDASFFTSFGQTGSGPGETLQAVSLFIRSDNLYVYDSAESRINVYSIFSDSLAVPEYSHTVNITGEVWNRVAEPRDLPPSLYAVRSDGSFLIRARTTPQVFRESREAQGSIHYHVLNPEDRTVSEAIFRQQMQRHIVTEWFTLPLPFFGKELMTMSSDDRIFSARSNLLLIKEYNPVGQYQRSSYYAFDNAPLYREDAINSLGEIKQLQYAIQNIQIPDSWPALHALMTDDEERLWLATIVANKQIYEWWIVHSDGGLLARFDWPREKPIEFVKNGYLYTRETDQMDIESIVKYRIEMERR